MKDTLAYRKGKNSVPNRAYGHSRKDGVFVETDQSSTSATLGDGGVYSNLVDLAKWDEALRTHIAKRSGNAARTDAGETWRWPGDELALGAGG